MSKTPLTNIQNPVLWEPLNYNPKPPSILGRSVIWYNNVSKSDNPHARRAAAVAMVVAAIFMALLILTIPLIIKFVAKLRHERDVERFYEEMKTKEPPPIEGHIEIESKTQTFNHVSSYVIYQDTLWVKQRRDGHGNEIPNGKWKPIYFDGWPERKPVELKADGANLIVIDDKRGVHYKKVIKEKFDLEKCIYTMHDKSDKDNWKDRWFTLPYYQAIVNLFTGKRLYLPESTRDFAIGHRGQFTLYIQDRDGNPHPVSTGVTTLYVLDESGRYIYLYDPWKPKNVKVRIPIPGTAESPFIAEKINAAGSQIMLIGYRYEKQEDGKILKKPEVQTMMVDVDSLGWNPTITYAYEKKKHQSNPKVRLLPTAPGGLKPHQLPPGPFSSQINILQTGLGNASREMRIVGRQEDQTGYWHKKLDQDAWEFVPSPLEEPFEAMASSIVDAMPEPIVHHWKATENYAVQLKNFNNESIDQEITVDGVQLLLHRRENIIKKIVTNGKEFHEYDLVLPEGTDKKTLPKKLRRHFAKSRRVKVKVIVNKNRTTLRIKGRGLSRVDLRLSRSE